MMMPIYIQTSDKGDLSPRTQAPLWPDSDLSPAQLARLKTFRTRTDSAIPTVSLDF